MILYEKVISHVNIGSIRTRYVHSTIRVKQGSPISPTFFELYIDELEILIIESFANRKGCLHFGTTIMIFLFVDNIILMSYTIKGLK